MALTMKHFALPAMAGALLAASSLPGDAAGRTSKPSWRQATAGPILPVNHADGRRWHRHRAYRYHTDHDHADVGAPFTRVQTGYGRRVAVDAPLTSVRVSRRGVWVRAPFVDLYIPH